MAGITKERYNKIQKAAMKLVAFYGIHELDKAQASVRILISNGFAAQLMAEFGIGKDAARGHIAKACRRQRHPDWAAPSEWGGKRNGAGKKASLDAVADAVIKIVNAL